MISTSAPPTPPAVRLQLLAKPQLQLLSCCGAVQHHRRLHGVWPAGHVAEQLLHQLRRHLEAAVPAGAGAQRTSTQGRE